PRYLRIKPKEPSSREKRKCEKSLTVPVFKGKEFVWITLSSTATHRRMANRHRPADTRVLNAAHLRCDAGTGNLYLCY
ncbi:hypothetical protein KBY27_22475, partial [Ruegeria pomeroyi]